MTISIIAMSAEAKPENNKDASAGAAKQVERDPELWAAAVEAVPIEEKPNIAECKEKQAPLIQDKNKLWEQIHEIGADTNRLQRKLMWTVDPQQAKELYPKPAEGEEKKPSHRVEWEKIQEAYLKFKDDSSNSETRIKALTHQADAIMAEIRKLSSGLLAHSKEENLEKQKQLELRLEAESLSHEEEKDIVNKIQQLRKEMAYTDALSTIGKKPGRRRRKDAKRTTKAVEQACSTNPKLVSTNITQTTKSPIYVIIDELKKQEKKVRDEIKSISSSGKQGWKALEDKADSCFTEITNNKKKIEELQEQINKLSADMDAIYNEHVKKVNEWKENRRVLNKKRLDKYYELLNARREANRAEFFKKCEDERKQKKDNWVKFVEMRNETANDLIKVLEAMYEGNYNALASLMADKTRDHLFSFRFALNPINEVERQLSSVNMNYIMSIKGLGSKETDKVFEDLIKKTEEPQDDQKIKIIPPKKQQKKQEQKQEQKKGKGGASKRGKVISLDTWYEEKPANESEDGLRLSEGQTSVLEHHKIECPKEYADLPKTLEALSTVRKELIKKEIDNINEFLKRLDGWLKELLEPPETAAENKSPYWIYIPEGLINEAFSLRDEAWLNKLNLRKRGQQSK